MCFKCKDTFLAWQYQADSQLFHDYKSPFSFSNLRHVRLIDNGVSEKNIFLAYGTRIFTSISGAGKLCLTRPQVRQVICVKLVVISYNAVSYGTINGNISVNAMLFSYH